MKIKTLLKGFALSSICVLLFSLSVFAQNAVKGTIHSTTREALAGATITVKGTNRSVVTDTTGNFTIDAPQGSTLIISSVGFQEKEVKVKGNALAIDL
ncbi:MAG: carboxypeptidase-like regulatory domain-containing protein, partial [Segetibacter sp.]